MPLRQAMPATTTHCNKLQLIFVPSKILRPGALAAAGADVDGAVGDADAEGGADGAVDQADLAAVRAHQLGGDGEPEAGAAGAGRALESLEQMRPCPFGQAGA